MSTEVALIQPQAQEQIAVASGRAQALLGQAKALTILDATSREFAANLRSQITTYGKQLETARLALVKPLNDHVKRINDGFRAPVQTLDSALTAVDAELRRDRSDQQRLAEEARRKAAEETARLQREATERARQEAADRAAAAAAKTQQEAVAAGFSQGDAAALAVMVGTDELLKPTEPVPLPVVLPSVAPPAKSQTTDAGARLTFTKTWDVEVLDLDLVPVKYLRRELKKAEVLVDVRAGVREIPGLRIFETERPSGR